MEQLDANKVQSLFADYAGTLGDDWGYVTPALFYSEYYMKGNSVLLDVRKKEDFDREHIPGAHHIFWIELLQSRDKQAQLPPYETPIFLICYVGHTASQLMVLLRMAGWKDVKVIKFGMGTPPDSKTEVLGWKQLNLPTCKTRKTKRSRPRSRDAARNNGK